VKTFLIWILFAVGLVALMLGLRSAASATIRDGVAAWPDIQREPGEAAFRVVFPDGETLEFPSTPRAILPANAAFVDMLSVLVDADRIRALPKESNEYSRLRSADPDLKSWSELPHFGSYGAETILPFEPDLILVHAWQKADVTALLRNEGLPVVLLPLPRRWEDIDRALLVLGRILDVESRAERIIEQQRLRIEALRSRSPFAGLRAISYTNLGTGGTVAGSGTTADILFGLAGLENAAASAGLIEYQSLDLEGLLRMDPDVIVVDGAHSDAKSPPTAAFLYAQEGLENMRAIRGKRVIAISTELFTTTSQELLRGAEILVAELEKRGL